LAGEIWNFIVGLLPSLGDMFKQALINAFTNTITNLLTNAIASLADAVSDIARRVGGPLSFLGDAVSDFAQNLSAQLQNAVMKVTGALNLYMQETAGVLNKQIDISNKIVEFVDKQSEALGKYLETEQERLEKTGAAVSALVIGLLSEEPKRLRDFTNIFFEDMTIFTGWNYEEYKTDVDKALGYLQRFIEDDLRVVETLSDAELGAAASGILEVAQRKSELVYDWFMQTVAVPISQSRAYFQAMRAVLEIDPEELKDQLEMFEQVTMEYYQKRAKEMARKVEELPGGGPTVFTPR